MFLSSTGKRITGAHALTTLPAESGLRGLCYDGLCNGPTSAVCRESLDRERV